MEMCTCDVISVADNELTVSLLQPIQNKLIKQEVKSVEIWFDDGRTITTDQRRKIFAIIRDIAIWSGHDPEYLRGLLTWDFRAIDGRKDFSLSDCDMTTAREFINYLIDFCFRFEVPTKDTLLNQCDDIGKYLYLCLMHRKCAVCNMRADVHHVDRVGMGRNRDEIVHVGMRAIALCRRHHQEAHGNEAEFFEHHHIYGIKLDKFLCDRLKLNTKEKNNA